MSSWQALATQLRAKGVEYKLVEESRKGPQLRVCCPICGDRRYRLYYGVDTHWAFCHNEDGRITQEEFYALFGLSDLNVTNRVDFQSVIDRIKEDRSIKRVQIPKTAQLAWYDPSARAYLHKRGVTREQAQRYMLLYCDHCPTHLGFHPNCLACQYHQRIIIPVLQAGFVARDITGKSDRKYLNSVDSKMSQGLLVSPQVQSQAILVEGVWDFFHVERLGFPGVCIFGKELSHAQLGILRGHHHGLRRITWLLDSDPAGVEAAKKVAERYSREIDCWVATLPEGKDPDESSKDEIEEALKKAKHYSSSLGRR